MTVAAKTGERISQKKKRFDPRFDTNCLDLVSKIKKINKKLSAIILRDGSPLSVL